MSTEKDDFSEILRNGEFESLTENYLGTNSVFICSIRHENIILKVVYKPLKGEAPLHDFQYGTLFMREMASYLISQHLGWEIIPLTIIRDGPYGLGTVQLYIDHNPDKDYFSIRSHRKERLKQIAVFDIITNNADRKASHFLIDDYNHVWGIDHGLTFNIEYKLRTIVWDFINEPFSREIISQLESLKIEMSSDSKLLKEIGTLLTQNEIQALIDRLEVMLEIPSFPTPSLGRNIPWPPI